MGSGGRRATPQNPPPPHRNPPALRYAVKLLASWQGQYFLFYLAAIVFFWWRQAGVTKWRLTNFAANKVASRLPFPKCIQVVVSSKHFVTKCIFFFCLNISDTECLKGKTRCDKLQTPSSSQLHLLMASTVSAVGGSMKKSSTLYKRGTRMPYFVTLKLITFTYPHMAGT